jgi:hypothetical protein
MQKANADYKKTMAVLSGFVRLKGLNDMLQCLASAMDSAVLVCLLLLFLLLLCNDSFIIIIIIICCCFAGCESESTR